MEEYADTAWRGEEPQGVEFEVKTKINQKDRLPVRGLRAIKMLAQAILILGIAAGIIIFGMVAFGAGLRPSVMIDNPFFPVCYALILMVAIHCFVLRRDERKQRRIRGIDFEHRAILRLKPRSGLLNILDFSSGPTFPSFIRSFRNGTVRPSKWRRCRHKSSNYEGVKWDEEELAYVQRSSLQRYLRNWQFICWPVVLLGWPLVISHLFTMDVSEVNIPAYVVFFLISGGGVVCPWLFKHYYRSHRGPRKLSLNRRTGMVALFEKGEEVFRRPFVDLNCYLKEEYFGGRRAVWTKSLFLACREEQYPKDYVVSLDPFVVNTSQMAFFEAWEIIKCYMNVTLPLPECLFLASRRPFDPTTAAYDKEHDHSLVVTENMSDGEFRRLVGS